MQFINKILQKTPGV